MTNENAFASDTAYACDFQAARDAIATLARIFASDNSDAAREAMVEGEIPVGLLAEAVRQFLPTPDGPFPHSRKVLLMEFGEELGSEWVPEFKRAADFLNAVSDF